MLVCLFTNQVLCSSTYQPYHFHHHHSKFHMLIPTQNCSTMEMRSTKMYGHVGKAFTHWRYISWRLLRIAEKMLIHHLMLTLQHQYLRHHDHWMGLNYASTTLMQKIMIQKSVSMPTLWCSNHMETMLLKDDLKILNLDDQHKATSRDHPTH